MDLLLSVGHIGWYEMNLDVGEVGKGNRNMEGSEKHAVIHEAENE